MNNSAGGLAVSVDNVQAARKICDAYHIPLLLDASRFAENAYLIAERDPTRAGREPRVIAREVFDLADGAWASLKKDGFGNIGGVLALRDQDLADRCRNLLIATEGYSTYGGLAGRDLAALAIGLTEVTDIDYLRYRAQSTEWFGEQLASVGMPVVRPIGCHAVYIDAAQLLRHISPHQFPGQSLACEFYLAGAVRTCELGSLTFGTRNTDGTELPARREYVRLAVPRRVYTRSHFEYVVNVAASITKDPERLSGMRILRQPPILRHFTAELEPTTKCI